MKIWNPKELLHSPLWKKANPMPIIHGLFVTIGVLLIIVWYVGLAAYLETWPFHSQKIMADQSKLMAAPAGTDFHSR